MSLSPTNRKLPNGRVKTKLHTSECGTKLFLSQRQLRQGYVALQLLFGAVPWQVWWARETLRKFSYIFSSSKCFRIIRACYYSAKPNHYEYGEYDTDREEEQRQRQQ